MKYSINFKLLAILSVGAVSTAGAVHLVHTAQVRRSSGALLKRAETAGNGGRVGEQLDLLKRYLVYHPEDTDSLERYGLVLARSSAAHERSRALEILERVLAKEPGRALTRRTAAGLARDLGQWESARTHYEILASTTPGGDAAAEEAIGGCEEELRRYPEAAARYERAIAREATRVDSHARFARLLRDRLKKPDQADLIMDARAVKGGVIARNPRSAGAFLARASYRREYAIPGGDDDIRQALALAPDDADVLLGASRVVPPDEAIRILTRAVEAHPDDIRLVAALAFSEAGAGDRGQAIDHLKTGLGRMPKAQDLRWILVEYLIDEGRWDEALSEIKRIKESGVSGPATEFLDARTLAGRQRWTEAVRSLAGTAPALETMTGMGALAKRAFLLLAGCHRQLENPDMRYSAARRAVALEVPDPVLAVAARIELAGALAGLAKFDEAAEEYRIALRMPKVAPRLRVELGRILVAKNLRLPAQGRQWDEVERVLGESEALEPNSADLAILRAEVLAARDQMDQAGEQLRRAEAARPDAPGPQVARAALAERQGRPGEALDILEGARKRLGNRPELLSALIQYWSGRPGESGQRGLAGLVGSAKAVADESDRRRLLAALADGLDRGGDAAGAAAIRDRLVAEQPDHLGLRLSQLDAALRAGDFAAAGRVIDEVRRIEGPEGSFWRYGRAQVLIRSSRVGRGLDEARALLAEARERRPGWARATLAAAEVDDMRGDTGSALRGYLAALDGGERDPGAIRRAVQLLYRKGRFAQADDLLRRTRPEGALSPELGRLAADVALRADDDERAIEIARRAVTGRPDSGPDQTWLGQLLFTASRKAESRGLGEASRAAALRSEAEKALARGVELAPTNPDAQVALVLALTAWGRGDEARVATARAETQLKDPAGELALARCLETIGRADEAEARYREILRARPDDVGALQAASIAALRGGKVREAEPILRRLIALRSKTPREAAWARRVLALALTVEGRGGSSRARELLGLDDEAVGAAPGAADGRPDLSSDDVRARAQVLARLPGRASRRKAVAMIESLAARDLARPDDLFLRAQLLAADGDWKRARAAAQQILAERPSEPAILEFLARGQITSGDPGEAQPWIDGLARLVPKAPVVVELNARALLAKGKAAEAVALLDGLVAADPACTPSVAALLEGAGQQAAAEAILRRAGECASTAVARVDASLALAAFLGRMGRHTEAIATCEGLWADSAVAPFRISSVAVQALYAGHPGEDVARRVESRIAAAVAAHPTDIALRFDMANLAILRGRYADAEATFRALHDADPNLGAPLNNLAWLLALRGGGSAPLDLIDRAIALDGPEPGLLDTRGLVLALGGQPERAVADLEESVAADPSPTGYFHLALALRKAGRPAEAAEALGRARASGLRPDDVHPLERPSYLELVAALPQN